ncbi:MAG: polysaccharide biosynthesis C-terminal domain-containing protein [Bacteroidota bacterium]
MGVVQRQSIKHSIVSVLGILIGAISTLAIYPNDRAFFGKLSFIIDSGTLLFPILSLGAASLAIRYFPYFKNEKYKHQGFLGFLFLFAGVGILIVSLLIKPLEENIFGFLNLLEFKVEQLKVLGIPIYLIAILLIYSKILTNYISNFARVAIPNVLNNLFLKIALPIIVFLHFTSRISAEQGVFLLIAAHLFILIALNLYTIRLGQWFVLPKFDFLKKDLLVAMLTYASFNILSSMGSTISTRIDGIMVAQLVDFEATGDYKIFLLMANPVNLALLALAAISGPIISEKLKARDLKGVEILFKKTSINGLVLAIFIYVGVWTNLDDLITLTGKYELLKPMMLVFVLIGLSKIFDVATSINYQIIGFSKYYRFNLVMVLFLAVLNVVSNYIFIKELGYGAIGAAMATCLSLFLYNLARIIFIWMKFKIHPFQRNTLFLLLIGLAVLGLGFIIPSFVHPILSILVRGIIITLCYISLVFYVNISKDVNELILKYWAMLKALLTSK